MKTKLIKKYLEFIKEDVNDHFDISKLKDKSLWNLSESEIRECFIEFEDAGYEIKINLIFIEGNKITDKLKAGMKPGYLIKISEISGTNTKTDLSNNIKEIYDYIEDIANVDIKIYDTYSNTINIDGLTIKNGIYNNNENINYLETRKKEFVILRGKQKESKVNITEMDLLEYYKWDKDEIIIENDKLFIELKINELVDMFVLSDQKDFIKVLKNRDNLWDLFDMENFCSSENDYYIISNNLDSDNFELFMKCLIKEYGGCDKILASITEYNDIDDDESLKDKSEDEILDYISENEDIFNFLFEDSEVATQIRHIIEEYETDAYSDDYYNALVKEFDNVIGKYFEFTKNQKEITNTETYQDISTFYKIEFDNSWIDEIEDGADLVINPDYDEPDGDECDEFNDDYLDNYLDNESNSLIELMKDWFDDVDNGNKLNPNFPEYANIDSKKFNSDLNGALQSYISDPNATEIEI